VVTGKTDLYGVSAGIGFTRASDSERKRIEAFIRRCKRSELCSAKTKTFAEICDISDDQLSNITRNPHHILNQLLPSVSTAAENYNLRPCNKHNRHLPEHTARLFDANYIYRLLYSDIY